MPITEPSGPSPAQILSFRRKLMFWYRANARQLPWRGTRDPYQTWVSEVMLQQTRVAAVIDHYERFLRLFPTIVALALAPESDVLAAWSGLGYYRRARSLHQAAQFLVRERGAQIPSTAAELRTLPGIGEYTCAAIASIAFGERAAVVDGNVDRVLMRVSGRAEDASAAARAYIRAQAEALVPNKRMADQTNAAGDHNQAMMELGATICLPRAPLCDLCPVYDFCSTRGEHVAIPRRRQRSRTIACLLATRKQGARTQVLLARRSADATLMPNMLELPPLPLDAVTGASSQQPILRLRHSITDTNYLVDVYAQSGDQSDLLFVEQDDLQGPGEPAYNGTALAEKSAAALDQPAVAFDEPAGAFDEPVELSDESDRGSSAQPAELASGLLKEIPVSAAVLWWHALPQLSALPLTGLARKILLRANLFSVAGPQTP